MADVLKQASLICHKTTCEKDGDIFCTEGPDNIDCLFSLLQKRMLRLSMFFKQFNKSVNSEYYMNLSILPSLLQNMHPGQSCFLRTCRTISKLNEIETQVTLRCTVTMGGFKSLPVLSLCVCMKNEQSQLSHAMVGAKLCSNTQKLKCFMPPFPRPHS